MAKTKKSAPKTRATSNRSRSSKRKRKAHAQRKTTRRTKTAKRPSSRRLPVDRKKKTSIRPTKRTRQKTAPTKRKTTHRRSKSRRAQPAHVEYAVNVNYRVKGRSNAISLQFSVIAQPGLTASEVQDIIIETIGNEGESPRGTKVRIVDWKGGRVPREIPWSKLAIIVEEPPTRFRVSQSRSH